MPGILIRGLLIEVTNGWVNASNGKNSTLALLIGHLYSIAIVPFMSLGVEKKLMVWPSYVTSLVLPFR